MYHSIVLKANLRLFFVFLYLLQIPTSLPVHQGNSHCFEYIYYLQGSAVILSVNNNENRFKSHWETEGKI